MEPKQMPRKPVVRLVFLLGLLVGLSGCGGAPDAGPPDEFAPLPSPGAVESESVAPVRSKARPGD
jgi:hypothetical protein